MNRKISPYHRLNCLVLIIFALASFFAYVQFALAQDYFSGGQGSNLQVEQGKVTFLDEKLDIKLHVGFAEVSQKYQIQNSLNEVQNVNFGFSYKQNSKVNGVDNIAVKVNGAPIELISNRELISQEQIFWKYFSFDFAPHETKTITVSHWQLNGANLRGLRTFNFGLANTKQLIGNLNINLVFGDQITAESFNKSLNPDLDLQIKPVGAIVQNNGFAWAFENLNPAFDFKANFYWPNGDLAKISHLDKNLALYEVISANNDSASQLADSSYLTSFKGQNFSATLGEQIKIKFDKTKTFNQFMIIPGVASSDENYLKSNKPSQLTLTFDDATTKTIDLEDKLAVQTFDLGDINSGSVQISVNSAFKGTDKLDNSVSIAEVEFNNLLIKDLLITSDSEPVKLNFRQKSNQFFQNIFKRLKSIF